NARAVPHSLDWQVELVGARVVVVAEVGKLTPAPLPSTGRALSEASKGGRPVVFAAEGVHDAQIYVGELLEAGMSFAGPAIVESRSSTVVVHPGNEGRVDDFGNVVITIGGTSG